MKIDYDIIKRILNAIQSQESHYILISKLFESTKPKYEIIDEDGYIDLFYGHLHLLKDNELIAEVLGENLGCHYYPNGSIGINGCYIRLTSKGYDYIKALNKNNVIEKLKNFTVSESVKIAETLLVKSVTDYADSLFG